MEPQETKHKLLKPLLIILGGIVLIGATGFGVWYWQQGEIKQQKTESDKQISEMQKQISDLKNESTTTKPTAPNTSTSNSVNPKDSQTTVPVLFSPARYFSESEKQEIKRKVTDPYIYYNNTESKNNPKSIAIVVEKYAENDRPTGSWYGIATAADNMDLASGWLFGENGKVEYWKPSCMGECPLSDAFKSKFPNNIP